MGYYKRKEQRKGWRSSWLDISVVWGFGDEDGRGDVVRWMNKKVSGLWAATSNGGKPVKK